MKSKSYWMNILDNCFKECDDTKENKKDITNNVFKASSDEIKLFNNNLNKLNDIVSKRKKEKIKLSFNNKYYNKNNNNGYYQNAEYLISSGILDNNILFIIVYLLKLFLIIFNKFYN